MEIVVRKNICTMAYINVRNKLRNDSFREKYELILIQKLIGERNKVEPKKPIAVG